MKNRRKRGRIRKSREKVKTELRQRMNKKI